MRWHERTLLVKCCEYVTEHCSLVLRNQHQLVACRKCSRVVYMHCAAVEPWIEPCSAVGINYSSSLVGGNATVGS